MKPWEQTWNDVKQEVGETVEAVSQTAQKALPWLREWGVDRSPTPAPSKPVEAPKTPSKFDEVFSSLIKAESQGKHVDEKGNLVTSKVGAQGITQLMPTTAKNPGYGIEPVKDTSEEEYMRVGKAYLQKMYDKFGDWEKALAAYNAGVGNVMKAEGKAERFGGDWKEYLPKKGETLPYIERILGKPRQAAPDKSKDATAGTRG